jgi:hypothetical protein
MLLLVLCQRFVSVFVAKMAGLCELSVYNIAAVACTACRRTDLYLMHKLLLTFL